MSGVLFRMNMSTRLDVSDKMDEVRRMPHITVITNPRHTPALHYQSQAQAPLSTEEKALATLIKFFRKRAAIAIQRAYRRHCQAMKLLAVALRGLRRNAAVFIQKWVRGIAVRRLLHFSKLKNRERIIRWTKPAKKVIVIGNFTNPPWAKILRLTYLRGADFFFTSALLKMKLDQGTYHFKFRVDGVWQCSSMYPVSHDDRGIPNNCLMVFTDKRLFPRAISTRTLNSEAVSHDAACRPLQAALSPNLIPRSFSGTFSPLQRDFRDELPSPDTPVHLLFGACMFAHPNSQDAPLTSEGSADSYFIEAEAQLFGLADGVGEWETYGLDASLFPSELMLESRLNLLNRCERLQTADESTTIDLMVDSLNDAEGSTRSFGSSTALLGFCKNRALHVIYVGDSSFIILRKRESVWTPVYRSVEQQHSFNCPFQLARLPRSEDYGGLMARGMSSLVAILRKSCTNNQDTAQDAKTEVIKLNVGDIVVAGTDGLFDNLFDADIAEIVKARVESFTEICCLADALAKDLALKAVEKGWDPVYKSPFSKTAQKAGKRYTGGKLDDTTVVVGVAVPSASDEGT